MIQKALIHATKENSLDPGVISLIEGSMHLVDLKVEDVMIPRAQMTLLKVDDHLQDILAIMIDSAHSRFPVFDEEGRHVIGILLAKDLISLLAHPSKDFSLRESLRPPYYVPLSKRLHHLLNDFRRHHNHLAIVVDEHGYCVGLITIEDVLEQIVGEIEDEHDSSDDPMIFDHGDHKSFTVKAVTPISDFNQFFNTNFDTDLFDTIGGWLCYQFGYLPKKGETISAEELTFQILRSDMRRVYLLKVFKKN